MTTPTRRPRRLRRTRSIRTLTRETRVAADDLIQPRFVVPGTDTRRPIDPLPGHHHESPDVLEKTIARDRDAGLNATLLFGIPDRHDENGTPAADPQGPTPQALRRLDDAYGDQHVLIADTCLCAYTTHGHCGVLTDDGRIDNDATLARLADAAVTYADAGADWIAPSDMMDGRIRAIREALDDAGHTETGILSYAAKYRSAYYGPFRHAQQSAPRHGDRSTYQIDPANARQGLQAVQRDLEEGADAVMVKPGLPYLDILRRVKESTHAPVAAYHVSGEHAMIESAAQDGRLEKPHAVQEALTCLARAGADWIVSYHAREALEEGWV